MGSQKLEAAGWCRSPCRRQIPWSNIVWIHFQRARINPPQCGVIGKWETIVMLNFDWRPSPGWALIGFNRRWNWIATTGHTLGPSAASKQPRSRRRTEQLYHRPGRARKVSKWCFLAAWVKVNVTLRVHRRSVWTRKSILQALASVTISFIFIRGGMGGRFPWPI